MSTISLNKQAAQQLKIVLVSPISRAGNGGFILGLAYISAMLKQHGFSNISGFDLMYQKEKQFLEACIDADLVGFYCTTRTFREVRRLAATIKQKNQGCLVIVGGPHPTLVPDQVIAVRDVDVVGIGEGEFTMLEIAQNLADKNRNFSAVKGIYWKKDKSIIINPARELLTDLDRLPLPDWDLFDRKNYHRDIATPIASRGCPYNCINCMPALNKIAGSYRRRSVTNVVAELNYLKKQYGINHIFFQDNDLSVNRKWLIELCDQLIKRQMQIRWHALCRVNTLDQYVLHRMKQAGCVHINIGAESGSQRVINLLNKKIDLKQVHRVIDWCNRESIETTVFFMIGIPGETLEEMRKTINFAAHLKADDLMISVAQPVPHTKFEKICLDNQWLLTDNPDDFDTPDETGGMKCWIQTDQWGPKDVQKLKREAREIFHAQGWREIDNKFLFRNFSSILCKRDWHYVGLMFLEEWRKFVQTGSVSYLRHGLYFLIKKLQLSVLTGK